MKNFIGKIFNTVTTRRNDDLYANVKGGIYRFIQLLQKNAKCNA